MHRFHSSQRLSEICFLVSCPIRAQQLRNAVRHPQIVESGSLSVMGIGSLLKAFVGPLLDSKIILGTLNTRLVSGSRSTALGRFFWNAIPTPIRNSILMRVESDVVLDLKLVAGVLRCSPGDDHYLSLIQDGLGTWERTTQEFWKSQCVDAEVVVDVGAYLGVYSILAAKVAPSARVIALEPNPWTFVKLKENLSLNTPANFELHNLAAGSSDAELQMIVDPDRLTSSGASISSGDTEVLNTFKVQQVTLDQLVQRADLIKIDAEGWELPVLQGATELLRSSSPTLVLEILSAGQFEKLNGFLKPFGYRATTFLGTRNHRPKSVEAWYDRGNYAFQVA